MLGIYVDLILHIHRNGFYIQLIMKQADGIMNLLKPTGFLNLFVLEKSTVAQLCCPFVYKYSD